jgi:hypothetical protein
MSECQVSSSAISIRDAGATHYLSLGACPDISIEVTRPLNNDIEQLNERGIPTEYCGVGYLVGLALQIVSWQKSRWPSDKDTAEERHRSGATLHELLHAPRSRLSGANLIVEFTGALHSRALEIRVPA